MSNENENVSSTQVLLPVIMISVVVFLFLAFQTVILSQDRVNFDTAMTQQQPTVEQVQKVKTQLDALALGTLKLSQLGDKDAMNIIAQLKKAGVNVGDPSASASSAGVSGGMMPPPMGAAPASPSTPMTSAPPGMQHMPAMPPMAAPPAPAAALHPATPAK